ncbi:MAG: hypothetical protein IPP31_13425 [Chitinophagaceae bacterium]|nr:hypothetical protein [Chitinophagaceae bacterium]
MKRIKFKKGVWHLDSYFKYIESLNGKINERLFAFISNKSRYIPNSPECLHDSKLISFLVYSEGTSLNIKLDFLGPFHDRLFKYKFEGVSKYNIKNENKLFGDLLMHEFSKSGKNNEYRFEFEKNASLYIYCTKIKIKETKIINPSS